MVVTLISKPEIDPDYLAGMAAATCTGSKNAKTALKHSMASGHDSVAEHAVFTFRIEGVSRSLLAQLTRHRIASFSVQSQRYVDQSQSHVIVPASILSSKYGEAFMDEVNRIRELYNLMVADGIAKEDARYILPEGTETSLVMTMNARELRHFFRLRCCNRAQWEIRYLADAMLAQCRKAAPMLFEKCGPSCVTEGKCHEVRTCAHPRSDLK